MAMASAIGCFLSIIAVLIPAFPACKAKTPKKTQIILQDKVESSINSTHPILNISESSIDSQQEMELLQIIDLADNNTTPGPHIWEDLSPLMDFPGEAKILLQAKDYIGDGELLVYIGRVLTNSH